MATVVPMTFLSSNFPRFLVPVVTRTRQKYFAVWRSLFSFYQIFWTMNVNCTYTQKYRLLTWTNLEAVHTCLQSILILSSASILTVGLTITLQVVGAATVRCRLPTVATSATCPSRESRNRAHTVAEVHGFVCRREVHGFGLLLYGPRTNETRANRNRLGRVHRAGGATVKIKQHTASECWSRTFAEDFELKLPSINTNHQHRYI